MLKKVIELNLDDLCLVLGVPAGLFLLTHLITAGVLVFFHADSSLMISGALLPVCSGILMAIVTVAHVGISFFHFLRFGQTRQRALAQSMGIIAFEGGCSLAVTALLTALEHWVAPRLWLLLTGYPALEWGVDGMVVPDPAFGVSSALQPGSALLIEDFTLDWWWFPLLTLGGILIGIIISTITARFGSRGGWALWCTWMLMCFGPQLLGTQAILTGDFLIWTGVVVCISGLATLIWSFYFLLHAPVKN